MTTQQEGEREFNNTQDFSENNDTDVTPL